MPNNQMPHNIDAEKALLGCILLDESIQSELLETLHAEDFYEESHRLILAAMKEVYGGRKTVDLVTLIDMLERKGTLDRSGGFQYISELSELMPSAANYKQYLEIVRRDAVNRSLIRAAKDIITNSMTSPEDREAISYAEKLVYDVSKQEDRSELTGLADGVILGDIIHKFEEIQSDPNAFRGVETGFKHLDRITHGLQKGAVIILAARPGVGKTSFAMNIVEHACLNKKCVAAVFSLEMTRMEIGQRLICAHAGVSMERALSGKLAQRDWKNLLRAGERLQKSKIFIDDNSVITPAEMLSKCRRLKRSEGLDLIVIDYIQLMEGGGKSGAENRQQEIANISRSLKIMAKELEVPVIALSQLRRTQNKEASLSDLRESGAIEQDADIVIFIKRADMDAKPEDYASGAVVQGAVELHIAKHRSGATGKIPLRFLGEQTKFVDVEDQGAPIEEPQYYKKKNADFDENPEADDMFPPPYDTGIPED